MKAERTITIENDGSIWTMTMKEARELRKLLDDFIDPEQSSSGLPSSSSPPHPSSWTSSGGIIGGIPGARRR